MSIANCITFWIAVVGFALSIYNFVKSLIANHKRLCISVKQIYNEAKFTVMLVEFTNKSQLGISVTRGEINGVPFGEQSTTLYTYTHPELNKRPVINTEILPLYIARSDHRAFFFGRNMSFRCPGTPARWFSEHLAAALFPGLLLSQRVADVLYRC